MRNDKDVLKRLRLLLNSLTVDSGQDEQSKVFRRRVVIIVVTALGLGLVTVIVEVAR